jgi:hypothetical protein
VWCAIISSSFVGITHAVTRLSAVLIRGPFVSLDFGSSFSPSHAAFLAHPFAQAVAVLADARREDDLSPKSCMIGKRVYQVWYVIALTREYRIMSSIRRA